MELSEIIEKLLAATGLTQHLLAMRLGTTQGKVSDMLQGRSTWEKHWQVFLKLLPLCIKHDLIGERELLHGPTTTKGNSKAGKAKANSR